jgi:hypothetical protein
VEEKRGILDPGSGSGTSFGLEEEWFMVYGSWFMVAQRKFWIGREGFLNAKAQRP